MKKLLLFIACSISSIGLAQQVYFEGFENGFPGTMTSGNVSGTVQWSNSCTVNTGGAVCPITGNTSATFFVNSYNTNVGSLTTPTLNLASGAFLLKFKHIQRSWQGDINELVVRISTNGGSSWVVMNSYTTEALNSTERIINLSQFNPTATTQIQFAAVNRWGYASILDDIEVFENAVQNDVSLNSVDVPSIFVAGTQNISGAIQNQGGNTVNSFNIKWQLNNGAINTQSLTNLNLGPGQIFNYNHQTPWNAQAGSYSLKVWVDNVNGVVDTNLSNNEIIRTITVATQQTNKTPLLEKFTANWCGPCASYNNNTFNSFFNNNNQNFTYISYHASSSDGNTNPDSQGRASYYQISGFPTQNINGRDIAPGMVPSATALNTNYNQALAEPGYFSINAQHQINGSDMIGNISVTPFISGTYKLHVAVIENLTSLHLGSNGETSFKHVLRRMSPNNSGNNVTFTHGVGQSIPFNINLSGLSANQLSNLSVIVFIQNDADKSILQSTYAPNAPLSNDTVEASIVKLYPNPVSDILYIQSTESAKVTVIDMSGKVLLRQSITEGTNSLPVSNLLQGVYLIQIQGTNFEKIEKFVKN
jgi:hypothetical protein